MAALGAKCVSVWSDGAAKHFKQGRTITFVCREWLLNVDVDYHFFGSYHGKGSFFFAYRLIVAGPCDGHAGHAKRMLRIGAARGVAQQTRRATADILDTNNNAGDWVTDIDSLRWYHISSSPTSVPT
jgi:hypothetical protein